LTVARIANFEGEGEESDQLSLSIFTIEVDRMPVFAIQSRKHSEAEAVLADENIRHRLSSVTQSGRAASLFAMTSRFSASDSRVQMNVPCTTKKRPRF
jgi:hypothetical protein